MGTSQDAAFLAAVVNGALDGIVSIDERGQILSFNPAATKLFGYSTEEVINKNVRILMPEPYCSEHDSYISNFVRTGEAKIIGIGRQVEGRRKDGSIFPMELGVSTIEADGKRFFVGFVHDLSERRAFEGQMQHLHANRLALIENLAVGLAHELRQPLTAINAYLNSVQRRLKDQDPDASQLIENARKHTFRVSGILENLRQFTSTGETIKVMESLNAVVKDACEFTDALARDHNVATKVYLEAESDDVIMNKIQIQQVVINLKRNAIEAMDGCDQRQMVVSTRLHNDTMVRVDIADTGPGLPDAIKERLFEPFTTTKQHGLGVGLSISRSIIQVHGGSLWAESNPAGGTTFSFVLPLANPIQYENRDRGRSPDEI